VYDTDDDFGRIRPAPLPALRTRSDKLTTQRKRKIV